LIVWRKSPVLRLRRFDVPAPPFFCRTVVSPYSAEPAGGMTLDYLAASATIPARSELQACDRTVEQLAKEQRLEEPLVVDATGFGEYVFGQGELAARELVDQRLATLLVLSSAGRVPDCSGLDQLTLGLALWPFERENWRSLFDQAQRCGAPWGIILPIVPFVSTELEPLSRLVDDAAAAGARFITTLTIQPEPPARRHLAALATADDESDEAYASVFEMPTETLTLATARHVAALADDRGIDSQLPLLSDARSNWNAATLLSRLSTRMLEMERDQELAADIHRSASIIARLPKPVELVAEVASLTIIEGLDEISVMVLEQWLRGEQAEFVTEIETAWRLRRDVLR
jgi:hypothetical protein